MAKYRILTFDGGGVRGAYSTVLLLRLAQAHPTLLPSVALFSGTSTGGIIALALAAGFAPETIVSWYRTKAREVFSRSVWKQIGTLDGWAGAEYNNAALKKEMEAFFGQTPARTLGDLRPKVLIPSFDLQGESNQPRIWKPKFFHNYDDDEDRRELIVDVAMRTSAAPTYFPSYQGYIDGGVVANNPCMSALAQALHPTTGRQQLGDIRLLSIGTGINPRFIGDQQLDWGKAQWAGTIVDVLVDGLMDIATYECTQMLGAGQFFRLEEFLPVVIPMDAADQVDLAISYAEKTDLAPAIEWIGERFL